MKIISFRGMVSHLCDICSEKYDNLELAEKCEAQGRSESKVKAGIFVKYECPQQSKNNKLVIYGRVFGHEVGDVDGEHKLGCVLSEKILEVIEVSKGKISSSRYNCSPPSIQLLEEKCTPLSNEQLKEIKVKFISLNQGLKSFWKEVKVA